MEKKTITRRDFLKSGLAGAGLMLGSALLGGRWSKPVLAAGGLPAHAKASGDATATPDSPAAEYDLAWVAGNAMGTLVAGAHQVPFSQMKVQVYDKGTTTPAVGATVTLAVASNVNEVFPQTYSFIGGSSTADSDGSGVANFLGGAQGVKWAESADGYWVTVTATANGATPIDADFVFEL